VYVCCKIYVFFIYIKLYALYVLIYVKLNIYTKYTYQIAKYLTHTHTHTHTHTLVLTKAKLVQEIIENAIKIKTNFLKIII